MRCKIAVRRDGAIVSCDRPAKRYCKYVQPVADWLKNLVPDESVIDCCIGHCRKLQEQGADLTLIDRRKHAAHD